MRALALLFALGLGLAAVEAPAQSPESVVLTIDQDRLYSESRFGQDLDARIEAAARDLAAENRRIEADLAAEERSLTERRPGLPADEFKALADAFDEKVQRIRGEQEAKSADLARLREAGQQELFLSLAPILSSIVRDRGAAVLIDRRYVVLSADAIDITDEAIRRLDETREQGQPTPGAPGAVE